jgi:hypothetical protein
MELLWDKGIISNAEFALPKTTLDDSPSSAPAYSDYRVMDSVGMNKLPDGDYQILVGEKRIDIRWEDGRFRARP